MIFASIKCWDWEEDNDCEVIGETQITLDDLKKGKREFALKATNHPKPGLLRLEDFKVQQATFLDYIMSGIQLNLMIAIDYTKSNGDCTQTSR